MSGARRVPRLYRLLLRLYPADFRVRYADEMVEALHARLTDSRGRGPVARARSWAIVLEDLARSIPREHLRARRARTDPLADLPRGGGSHRSLHPRNDRSPSRASLMDTLRQDLSFAARGLRVRPAFALLVIVTLALGIGATTTIFSVLDGVVLRALPYPDPDRLVLIGSESASFSAFGPVSPYAFSEWRDDDDVFEAVSAVFRQDMNLTGSGDPEQLPGAAVSHEFFPILGAEPLLGRGLLAEDDRPGASRVVVLEHGLWQRRWGGDRSVVGSTITLDGNPWTVVGVMSPEFVPPRAVGTDEVEMWIPMAQSALDLSDRDNYTIRLVARLQDGVGIDAARNAMRARSWALDGSGGERGFEGGTLAGPNVSAVERSPAEADAGNVGFGGAADRAQAGNEEITAQVPGPDDADATAGTMPAPGAETREYRAGPPGPGNRSFGDRAAAGEQLEVAIDGDGQVSVESEPTFRATVVSMKERTVGDSATTLVPLTGAVGFLLLIACANVANLLLARATDREREISVRSALGAGRGRIVRQLLTESLLLGLVGGGAGSLLAAAGVRTFVAFNPGDLPRLQQVSVDGRVLLFALAVAVVTGFLFGVAPALVLSRRAVGDSLRDSVASVTQTTSRSRFRGLMVALETTLALILLVGAGLMANSFYRLQSVDPGFRPQNLVTLKLMLGDGYPEPSLQTGFVDRLVPRIAALPGVEAVGVTSLMPFGGQYTAGDITIENPAVELGPVEFAGLHQVTPDYFATMGIRLLHGRAFTERERGDGDAVVIVNETMARKYWGRTDVVGERFRSGAEADGEPWMTIVGVIADVRQQGLRRGAAADFFLPFRGGIGGRRFHVVARTAPGTGSVAAALRAAVRELDPALPTDQLYTMRELISGSVDQPRFYAALLGTFAAVAALLAAVGVYGSVSYGVGQRTREIGIRRALGASGTDLVRMVTRQGLTMVAAGLLVGLLGAWFLSGALAGFLFGIEPTDPATFGAVALLLATVAFVACLLPARRAARIDPMRALRE